MWFKIQNFQMIFVLFIVSVSLSNSQEIGTILYNTRLRYVGPCPTSDPSLFSLTGASTLYRTTEYWNGFANVSEDFFVDKVIFSAQKCGEGFYPCEKFVNIRTNAKNIKQFMYAKGQFWTPLWDSIHPQPELPMIHKNSYQMINATYDGTALVHSIPEIFKHFWKIQIDVYSKGGTKHFCFENHFYLIKYRLHPKRRKN